MEEVSQQLHLSVSSINSKKKKKKKERERERGDQGKEKDYSQVISSIIHFLNRKQKLIRCQNLLFIFPLGK